jgi:hypothetical protein
MKDVPGGICSRLLLHGAVSGKALSGLERPEVRREVEARLRAVGLALAVAPESSMVGVRLLPEAARAGGYDPITTLDLRSDACALLAVLWVRLVRPLDGPGRRSRPRVSLNSLVREFPSLFAGQSHLRRLIARLRRLRFLGGEGDTIEAGPLLEIGIDRDRMEALLRHEEVARLFGAGLEPPGPEVSGARREVAEDLVGALLETLAERGGVATMGDLSRATNAPASRIRRVLRELEQAGRIRRTGQRAGTRYNLP